MISEEVMEKESAERKEKERAEKIARRKVEQEKKEKDRDALVREALITWNKMARGFLMVVKAQKELDHLITERRLNIEELPLSTQSILAQVNPRGQLERVLEGLAYAIRSELELIVEIPEEGKGEKRGK